jgi:replicative DNA helicase
MSLVELHPVEKLINSGLSPEQAVRRLESPAQQIADIEVNFDVDSLPTGFPTFDKYMYFRRDQPDLVTIAARPGVGKSALAMQLAFNVSIGSPVEFFSLEMSSDQLMKRLYCVETGRSAQQLRHVVNRPLIEMARAKFRMLNLRIDDENGIDADKIYNRALTYNRYLQQQGSKIGMIVVDYVQIVTTPKGRSKSEEVGYTTEKMKKLALEIRAPIVVLAQMNREFDKRVRENPTAEPTMSDIADSAAIEKWSDIVLCLHRPHPNTLDIHGLKNRHGDKAKHEFQFVTELTKFLDNGQTEI